MTASRGPASVASLVGELRQLGLAPGAVVIVHTSLSALGWVAGGAQAVVEALFEAIGPAGTVVMPTQSGQLSDPVGWDNPPVPAAWIEAVRQGLPAFDPYLTPTRGMGQVVECFRQHRATVRSRHPLDSFAANGPAAATIVERHPLSPGLGEESPLGRLYELHSSVLLLGVSHANNTSLHLAEHRADWPGRASCTQAAPVEIDGERRWVSYADLDLDTDDFDLIGQAFAATGQERHGPVGAGVGRLSAMRAVVDFAAAWMGEHRGRTAAAS
jgi:aminoglycoside 3-N-acetyltransferase